MFTALVYHLQNPSFLIQKENRFPKGPTPKTEAPLLNVQQPVAETEKESTCCTGHCTEEDRRRAM